MTVRELREKYLKFFESKGHAQFPSGSLIPYDVTGRLDESLLFNGAGMVQFKPYFRGVATPSSPRLTTAQKCVRTGDIDEVGDTSHLTFFEMLGNFSFGDYFKEQAIAYSWEFLTSPEWLGLDVAKLSFTVFEEDDLAFECWSEHLSNAGIDPATRVFRLGEETNYWPAGAFSKGPPGPCGPNSEMFYWVSGEPPSGPYSREDWLRDDEARNWLEIWNDVFIQFEWQGELRNPDRPSDGWSKTGMPPLPFQSIDTGMGLERTAAVLMGLSSVYDTDVFQPILRKIEEVGRGSTPQPPSSVSETTPPQFKSSPRETEEGGSQTLSTSPRGTDEGVYRYGSDEAKDTAARIIADHIRTAVFCIADGVLPGNSGRGYVLRRLIRRAVLKGQRVLGIEQPFFHLVFEGVLESMGDFYGELGERRDIIVETLKNEEALFRRTLASGVEELNTELEQVCLDTLTAFSRAYHSDKSFDFPLSTELRAWIEADVLDASGRPDDDFIDKRLKQFDVPGTAKGLLLEMNRLGQLFAPELRHTIRPTLNGADAFRLYDTFGFPLEVTKELASEAGVAVDEYGYEEALRRAQERSRGGTERESVYGGVQAGFQKENATPTNFIGYESAISAAKIVGAVPIVSHSPTAKDLIASEGKDLRIAVALDQTPFYAESGGQIGDTGTVRGEGFSGRVLDVVKQNGVFVHEVEVAELPIDRNAPDFAQQLRDKLYGLEVVVEVDQNRRARITRNHTATHLLHAALRQVLGTHVTQAGSYVGPDRLRFDFTHGKAMTPEEIARVEVIVNQEALKNTVVTVYRDLPIAEAKAKGAMALFGEKYGDRVRMIEIGDFSRELCGGIHVRYTGEIGLFKIVSESSAASGVRRIEAVTGEGAYTWLLEQTQAINEAAMRLKTSPRDLLTTIDRLQEQIREERKKREKAEMALAKGAPADENRTEEVKGVHFWRRKFEDVDQKVVAGAVDDAVAANPNIAALAALVSDGKIVFIAKNGSGAVEKGAHAGNLLKEVAKIAGGGGGGRAEFATAGGRLLDKVDLALDRSAEILAAIIP